MAGMSRRSLINTSIGLAAAATLARPYIANAQAKTATIWWVQGFVAGRGHRVQEVRRGLSEGQRQQDRLSIIPFAPMRQKIVSAMTSGAVPDLFHEQPDRDHRAVCLGRQAGRCQRRRRDARGASSPRPRCIGQTATTM